MGSGKYASNFFAVFCLKIGVKELWCTVGQSSLDKRQCIMQVMTFADESTRILNSSSLKKKIYGEDQKKGNNEKKKLL